MGIVRKQSAYSTIFIYIGFAIGALNTLWLFPKFVSQDAFGLTRLFIDFSVTFSALSTLGSLIGLYKFSPFYKSYLKPQDDDLPFLTAMACVLGSCLFIIASFVFKNYLAKQFGHNSPLFVAHYNLVIPFTISFTCLMLLEAFCWVLKKSVISNLVKELVFRITTTILILLYIVHAINIEQLYDLFAFSYIPSFLILMYVIMQNGGIQICARISSVTKRLYKKILYFVFFHFSGMMIAIIPNTIDGIILAGLSENGLETLAVYSIPKYFVLAMDVPMRSMLGVTIPLISEAWRNKNRTKITELYQKSSLNLLIIGLGLFGLIYPNLDNLIRVEGPSFAMIKPLFLIMGLAKLFDLANGMNAQILQLSKYWRVDFYTSAAFILVNIVMDILFIRTYGVIGGAYATAISLVFYNLMRMFYLWRLYHIQPFTFRCAKAIAIALIAFAAAYFMPYIGNKFLDAAVRVTLFTLLFAIPILYFNVSEDMNAIYITALNKFLKKK